MAIRFTGYKNASTFGNDATVGTVDWTNPGDAVSSNDVYAQARVASTTTAAKDNSVKAIYAGAIAGNELSSGVGWGTTDAYRVYGSNNNMWGLGVIKVAVINATNNFGFAISAANSAGTTITKYLTATNFNFGIGTGNNIVGIQARVERKYVTTVCITGDTWVRTVGGRKQAKNIKPGDMVLGFNPRTFEVSPDTVTNTMSRIASEVIEIEAGGFRLTCTPNHEIYVDKDVLVPAAMLQVGFPIIHNLKQKNITAIRHIPTREIVYDITTETHHAYFANGFAVHNVLIGGTTDAWIDHMQMGLYYRTPGGVVARSAGMAI